MLGDPSGFRALCTSSVVNLPCTASKSPQWLVKAHLTCALVGDSWILTLAIIPLNTNILVPISAPVSGSRKTLCTSTFLFIKLGLAAAVLSTVIPLSCKTAVSSSDSSFIVKVLVLSA